MELKGLYGKKNHLSFVYLVAEVVLVIPDVTHTIAIGGVITDTTEATTAKMTGNTADHTGEHSPWEQFR